MPLSTTHRKVDILTEAGLLEKQIRISTSGKHTSEYALCVEGVQLSFGSEDGIELEVTRQAEQSMQSMVAGAD
jgi:predicted DNA-binding ArsR family transcriptional regulator